MTVDFMGIGAQKCGTTWLFERLDDHPQVRFPVGKELHFWNRSGLRLAERWLARFPAVDGAVRQGEITPAYALLPHDRIALIQAAAPDLRLFYSVRNPMARAWSAALMALQRAELTLDEASDQWFVDHLTSAGSRRRSDYLDCLGRWGSVFPGGALHLLLLDDIIAEPRRALVGLAEHLEIDPGFYEGADATSLVTRTHVGPGSPVRPVLLDRLRQLYAGDILRFGDHIGRDLSAWVEWDGGR